MTHEYPQSYRHFQSITLIGYCRR